VEPAIPQDIDFVGQGGKYIELSYAEGGGAGIEIESIRLPKPNFSNQLR
jgi:hypothetical protein